MTLERLDSLKSLTTISENSIHLWPEPIEQNLALGHLFDSWASTHPSLNPNGVWSEIASRGASEGFYVGSGLLLPHVRIPDVDKAFLAFGVCPSGFTGVKKKLEEPATMMCLLLSPEKNPMTHIYVIKHIAQKLMDSSWKERVLQALDTFEIKHLLLD